MPLGDWQFWVVTLAAVIGLGAVLRTVLPRRSERPRRTNLTIEGKSRR